MEVKTMKIDLRKFRPSNSTSFSGRPQGLAARKAMKMAELDKSENDEIHLVIPADTTSFNPSFFLGLVFESIKKLGIETFKRRYIWDIETKNEDRKRALLKNIDDGYRSADNSINNKSIFSFFS